MRYTETVHTDTTLDIDDAQARVSESNYPSEHSTEKSMFVRFAERASPTTVADY